MYPVDGEMKIVLDFLRNDDPHQSRSGKESEAMEMETPMLSMWDDGLGACRQGHYLQSHNVSKARISGSARSYLDPQRGAEYAIETAVLLLGQRCCP